MRKVLLSRSARGRSSRSAGRGGGPATPSIPAWLTAQTAGTWDELTGTTADTVDPCPLNNCSYSGTEGFDAIIHSWSGGCIDTYRKKFIIFGGGHGAYYGNEILTFDISSKTWARTTEPKSPIVNGDLVGGAGTNTTGYYTDGSPAARHTYNLPQYDSVNDQMIVGYAGATAGEAGGTYYNCDAYNFTSSAWATKTDPPTLGSYGEAYQTLAAMDGSGNYWMIYAGLAPLMKFDPTANTWTTYGSGYNYSGGAYCTAAVDTSRNRLVVIGSGFFTKTDLSSPSTTTDCGGTPTSAVFNGQAPGWVYDPIGDRFIGWVNGSTLYTVDAATLLTWGTISVSGSTPPSDTDTGTWNGTYGRFRYVPDYDCLLLVTQAFNNVFCYKFSR